MWYSSLLLKTPAIAEKKIHHVNVQDNHFFSRKAKGPEENNFIISTFKRLGVNLHAKLGWFGWAFFFFIEQILIFFHYRCFQSHSMNFLHGSSQVHTSLMN